MAVSDGRCTLERQVKRPTRFRSPHIDFISLSKKSKIKHSPVGCYEAAECIVARHKTGIQHCIEEHLCSSRLPCQAIRGYHGLEGDLVGLWDLPKEFFCQLPLVGLAEG